MDEHAPNPTETSNAPGPRPASDGRAQRPINDVRETLHGVKMKVRLLVVDEVSTGQDLQFAPRYPACDFLGHMSVRHYSRSLLGLLPCSCPRDPLPDMGRTIAEFSATRLTT